MAGTIAARLAELGIELPKLPAPAGAYVPYTISGKTLYISGQIGILPGENVVLEATLNGELAVRHARATTGGRFTVAFSGLAVVDRCSSDLLVRAIGARGSEAAAKIGPLPQCAPRN